MNFVDRTQGIEKRPKLLIVDDIAGALGGFAEVYKSLGFDVVKMHFDLLPGVALAAASDSSIINIQNSGEITKYALNPSNNVNAVLTDLNGPRVGQYGMVVAKDLASKGFNGPIAIHTSDWSSRMDYDGTVGIFDKKNTTEIADALHAALKQRGISAA